jgi:hypothetical protein
MEVDDGADAGVAGTSGRGAGGRGRAATLADIEEEEKERFYEVSVSAVICHFTLNVLDVEVMLLLLGIPALLSDY